MTTLYPFFHRRPFGKPASPLGWFILLLFVSYCAYQFFDARALAQTISNTITDWVFNVILNTGALLLIIAASSSPPASRPTSISLAFMVWAKAQIILLAIVALYTAINNEDFRFIPVVGLGVAIGGLPSLLVFALYLDTVGNYQRSKTVSIAIAVFVAGTIVSANIVPPLLIILALSDCEAVGTSLCQLLTASVISSTTAILLSRNSLYQFISI